MGAGISGGGHPGPTRQGGASRGCGRALHPRGQVLAPPEVFSMPKILKYSIKNHTKFAGHLENFYFRDILYCMDNSENRQKILLLLYLIYIIESKWRVPKVVLSNFIHLMLIKRNPLRRLIKSC